MAHLPLHPFFKNPRQRIAGLFLILIAGLGLAACESSVSLPAPDALSGYVVGDAPLRQALVQVYDAENTLLASAETDGTGFYHFAVPQRSRYRVVAKGAFDGKDLSALCKEREDCDLTPLTTLTAHLVEKEDYPLQQAKTQAKRRLYLCTSCEDPFSAWAKELAGFDAEQRDPILLAHLRGEIRESGDFEAWILEMASQIPKAYDLRLEGKAFLTSERVPLTQAEVRFITEDQVYTTTTDASGLWTSPEEFRIFGPFRMEVSGGFSGNTPFTGRLSAHLPFRDQGRTEEESLTLMASVQVNILSSFIDRYMRFTGSDHTSALSVVKRYLDIPEDMDLFGRGIGRYFSPYLFLEIAEEQGGFDFTLDRLVAHMDSGEVQPISDATNANYEILDVSFGYKVFDGILSGIGSGGVSYALGLIQPMLFNALGIETERDRFEGIHTRLSDISASLDHLDNKLDTIREDIEDLESVMKEQISLTQAHTSFTSIERNIAVIHNAYNDLKDFIPTDGSGVSEDKVNTLVNTLRRHDLPLELRHLHQVYFEPVNSVGAFELLTQALEQGILMADMSRKQAVLENAYQLLETRFVNTMAIQLKGALVHANILNWEDKTPLTTDPATLQGTRAKQFLDTGADSITRRLQYQTELFLTFVERLVVASADTRTIAQPRKDMFPSNTGKIFYTADLLARNFLPEHQAGFVIRVIGDPASFAKYTQAPASLRSADSEATELLDPTLLRTSPIQYAKIRGKTIREYPAPLPRGYTDRRYIGWQMDAKYQWLWKPVSTIQVAKIYVPHVEENLHRLKDKNLVVVYPYTPSDLSAPYTRKDPARIQYTNPNTAEITNADKGLLYGHATIIAREIPRFHTGTVFYIRKNPGCLLSRQTDYNLNDMQLSVKMSGACRRTGSNYTQELNNIVTPTNLKILLSMNLINQDTQSGNLLFQVKVREAYENASTDSYGAAINWGMQANNTTLFSDTYSKSFFYSNPANQDRYTNTTAKEGRFTFSANENVLLRFYADPSFILTAARLNPLFMGLNDYYTNSNKANFEVSLPSFEIRLN
ncbi:hypothetical protein [Desulfobotulus sp.]|uniref:hypothetical protein n=1 Tax=Desulfobotulus sp. TaxID=1940337 RepID=UPI002A365032|nr:hypothetical protein [Desulfobotulus sp.]MDY0162538.1 hypothetical protein [Desulfobotulus sp.]